MKRPKGFHLFVILILVAAAGAAAWWFYLKPRPLVGFAYGNGRIEATEVVDAALQPMRATLQADGYALEWNLEEPDRIGIRVFAASDACEDCLVPPEIMRAIITQALSETPYTVGSISLPPKS